MRSYFISGYNYIQDIILEAGTYTFWAYVNSTYGSVYTFALGNNSTSGIDWEVFDLDVQKGLWSKVFLTFTIHEKKTKLNLIYRYYDAENPVFVYKPQLIKGSIPSEVGASPFDIDQITDDLHDGINGIVDFTNEEFADRVLSASDRVSLRRDLESVEIIFQSLKGSYEKLLINPFITDDVKDNLTECYNDVATSKENLFSILNTIIAGDDIITDDENEAKNNALTAFNSALYNYNLAEKEIHNILSEDYNQKISAIRDFTDEEFADRMLSESEKKSLSHDIDNVQMLLDSIESSYNQIISDPYLTEDDIQLLTDKYNALLDAWDWDYDLDPSKPDGLKTVILDIINSDDIVTQDEIDEKDLALSAFNAALGDYSATEVEMSKRTTEHVVENIGSEIDDVNTAITDLNTYVDGAFKDGVINNAEAKAIAEHLKTLSKEKADIDNEFSVIYNNTLLSGTPETNLSSAYANLVSKYTDLVNAINTAIADEQISDTDRTNVNTGFTNYANSLKIFTQRIDEALNAIALQQSINTSADAYTQLADISDDNKLTPNDKQTTKKEWDIIVSEKPTIEAQATTYGITSEKTNYVNAYNALNTYITPLLSSLTTTSNIVGTTFREKFKTYYDAKTSLLKVITDWAKIIADNAQSDASDALAKANQSKAITDKFSYTEGGLIFSSLIELHNPQPDPLAPIPPTTAGISGIQATDGNSPAPAFWAGGTYAEAIEGIAKSIDRHDGSGHRAGGNLKWDEFGNTEVNGKINAVSGTVGIFSVDDLGNIKVYDPSDPTVIRLLFSKYALPLLQSLLDDNIYGGSVTNASAIGAEATTILPNKITVTQPGAEVHFSGVLNIFGFLAAGYSSGRIQVTVRIVNETTGETIYSIIDGRTLDYRYESFYSNTIGIDKTIYNVNTGTYHVEIQRINMNADDFSAGLNGSSTLSWSFTKDVRRFEFAKNGFMAFYQDNHMYFSEDSGLDVRGAANIPGVLLAGEAGITGGFTSVWGAKKHASNTATKTATGQYTVYHSVGHTDYQVQITPTTANRTCYIYSRGADNFVVYFYSVGSSPALADTGFHFSITGRNY